MRHYLVVCAVVGATACGRFGFDDPSPGRDGMSDSSVGDDAHPADGAFDAASDASASMTDAPAGTWSVFAPSPTTTASLWAIQAFAPNDIWVGGTGGPINHFNGTSWSTVAGTTAEDVYMFWGSSATDLWVVGRACTAQRWNGAMWTTVGLPFCSNQTVFAVAGSAANDVWIAGVGGLLSHTTGGGGWTDHAQAANVDLWSGWAQSPTEAYFVGTKGSIRHWTGTLVSEDIAQNNVILASVWGTGTGELWAVGTGGMIMHKVGTGAWAQVASPTIQFLYAVFGTSASDVWAVGTAGTLIHYDGSQWNLVAPPTTMTLRAIGSVPGGGLRIVGDGATVLAHP